MSRERAHVVAISNPEYQGIDYGVLFAAVLFLVLIIAVVVVAIILLRKFGIIGGAKREKSSKAVPGDGVLVCTRCGRQLTSEAQFCPQCGMRLAVKQSKIPSQIHTRATS